MSLLLDKHAFFITKFAIPTATLGSLLPYGHPVRRHAASTGENIE